MRARCVTRCCPLRSSVLGPKFKPPGGCLTTLA
nr:MAG TPA_asm: hypothetical protein [Caudoviricetes sp.]DAQ36649.1 MAG TPA: hypothetical protein [Caudoviricetes sp.]